MAPLVSVIVVNWNGLRYLPRCLAALAAQTYPAVEVILVDNGSTDGSAAWVTAHYPQVRLILNAANRGFAAANNQGIAAAQGDYLALLNNDAWAEPEWLSALVAAMERAPRVGMVASQMLFADRPEIINSTGICVDQCGISWDRHGGAPAQAPDQPPVEVFGPCAGAALYRRALFNEVGVFDEDFFVYLEDVDLAWRARWCGWQALYVPAARVYHVHSGTSLDGSPFKTFYLSQNKIQLLVRNYPLPYFFLFLPPILFYEALSLTSALMHSREASAWRGRMAGLRRLGRAWTKRHQRPAGEPRPAAEVFRWLEPMAAPWDVVRRVRHLASPPLRAEHG